MMKKLKAFVLLLTVVLISSCASTYQPIKPDSLHYSSGDKKEGISLKYKYDLLHKKYAKKEMKKGVNVVAIKITNSSEKDVVFGEDFVLSYENGNEIYLLDASDTFTSLKQSTPSYLLYLLLSPLNLYVTKTTNGGTETSSTPIGLVIGPGLAIGNMIAAGSANSKFKTELQDFNLAGVTIKKGETKSGLIGIRSSGYNAIRIKIIE